MAHKIITPNVKGIKIPFNNGIAWKVGDTEYKYGWSLVKDKDGKFFDVLREPDGTEYMGDIIETTRFLTNGDNPMIRWTEIVFQPHNLNQ